MIRILSARSPEKPYVYTTKHREKTINICKLPLVLNCGLHHMAIAVALKITGKST